MKWDVVRSMNGLYIERKQQVKDLVRDLGRKELV